jgi:hypothetical protein
MANGVTELTVESEHLISTQGLPTGISFERSKSNESLFKLQQDSMANLNQK